MATKEGAGVNGYEWDGTRWVPQTTGTAPGQGWAPPSATGTPPAGSQFPPLATGGAFTDPRYGYGLTRRASDDIQFIVRYMKIVIIVGLVILGLVLVTQFIALLGVVGLFGGTIVHH
jgi:hypothetical protein